MCPVSLFPWSIPHSQGGWLCLAVALVTLCGDLVGGCATRQQLPPPLPSPSPPFSNSLHHASPLLLPLLPHTNTTHTPNSHTHKHAHTHARTYEREGKAALPQGEGNGNTTRRSGRKATPQGQLVVGWCAREEGKGRTFFGGRCLMFLLVVALAPLVVGPCLHSGCWWLPFAPLWWLPLPPLGEDGGSCSCLFVVVALVSWKWWLPRTIKQKIWPNTEWNKPDFKRKDEKSRKGVGRNHVFSRNTKTGTYTKQPRIITHTRPKKQ